VCQDIAAKGKSQWRERVLQERLAIPRPVLACVPDDVWLGSADLALPAPWQGISVETAYPLAVALWNKPAHAYTQRVLRSGINEVRALEGVDAAMAQAGEKEKARDFQGAIAIYDGVLADFPWCHYAYVARGTAMIMLGRTQEALGDARRAIALLPTSPEYWLLLLGIFVHANAEREAIAFCDLMASVAAGIAAE